MSDLDSESRRKEQRRRWRANYLAKHGREKILAAGRRYYDRNRAELRRLRAEAGRI
jgi:hypothetical protein